MESRDYYAVEDDSDEEETCGTANTSQSQSPYLVDTTCSTKVGFPVEIRQDPFLQVQCNSESATKITISPSKSPGITYTYRVKIVNPERKSDFTMDKLSSTRRFKSIPELKQELSDHLNFSVETLGYIEPGHGLRGKQQWLTRECDLEDMYRSLKSKKEITIWCFRPGSPSDKHSRKRASSEGADPPAKTRRESCAKSITEVEELISKLREKHDKKYTTEQLSCWAHMLQMGKHGSLDDPPNLPFFTGRSRSAQRHVEGSSLSTRPTVSSQQDLSPTKKVHMRGESIKQLAEWHTLLQQGIVTREQYDDVQGVILKDMKENFM